jgi:Ca2+-binding RTX toxin-like protein
MSNGDASDDILSGFENLRGSVHNDILIGDASNNVITGGLGSDILTGGGGANTFDYLQLADKGDHITDFVSGTDKLQFHASGFSGARVGVPNFVSGTTPHASLVAATFLYNTTTGVLSYDPDGTGTQAAQTVLTLDLHPALAASDLFVV